MVAVIQEDVTKFREAMRSFGSAIAYMENKPESTSITADGLAAWANLILTSTTIVSKLMQKHLELKGDNRSIQINTLFNIAFQGAGVPSDDVRRHLLATLMEVILR